MALVDCIICGDIEEEEGTRCSFYIPKPLSTISIYETFPFEGDFHFRLKVDAQAMSISGYDYVWLDLVRGDDSTLSLLQLSNAIEIKALPIDLKNDTSFTQELFTEYLEEINQEQALRPVDKPDRSSLTYQTTNVGSILLKNISKTLPKKAKEVAKTISASSLWNQVKSTATMLHQSITKGFVSSMSDRSEENLANLSDDLSTYFQDANSVHAQLLMSFWYVYFPGQEYQRQSLVWKEAGWQTPDPVSDLKASGVLSIKAMTYLGRRFPKRTKEMIMRNKQNVKANYPFAIVGINVTLLLGEILALRDQRYFSAAIGHWELFEDADAFFELFCVCFMHVDAMWIYRAAVRADFAKIIGETKMLVSSVLDRAPKSVTEFKHVAAEEGMLVIEIDSSAS